MKIQNCFQTWDAGCCNLYKIIPNNPDSRTPDEDLLIFFHISRKVVILFLLIDGAVNSTIEIIFL